MSFVLVDVSLLVEFVDALFVLVELVSECSLKSSDGTGDGVAKPFLLKYIQMS